MMRESHPLHFYLKAIIRLVVFTAIIGFILRVVLMFNEQTHTSFFLKDYPQIFIFGFINDVCIAFMGTAFIFINQLFISSTKYRKPQCYFILAFLVALLAYLLFFDRTFTEFNKNVVHIVCWVLVYKCISFSLRTFLPKIRPTYSMVVYLLTIFVYVGAVLVNTIGEYFFWSEFGVRYNFIAVDYLIYTNEVIGNIMESYPIVPIFLVIALFAFIVTYFVAQNKWKLRQPLGDIRLKLSATGIYLLSFVLFGIGATLMEKLQVSSNVYVNELQANGVYKFYNAFLANELNYDQFYLTMPKNRVEQTLNKIYHSHGIDNVAAIKDTMPELHKNIVLIMVESLSAEYLSEFGNEKKITPCLDALVPRSMVFENLYACGNRTVRGLEAVTLSIPPSPGESIIKRSNNRNLFSVATVLKQKGYKMQFLYGGDSYFDNMREFFSGNGYEVIDKSEMSPEDISFSTVWGACDENLFDKAIKVFDKNAASGRPFYAHIMTTSNHRPYLYPEGKIDISPKTKSRDGGVKYTDYAIGQFLKAAQKKSWFKNTVFIIVADHCASSAGSTEVPLDQYHIPAFIYAPGFVHPMKINKLSSQIDIMPTVFGLLHLSYRSKFYGRDVLQSGYVPRALVATYQNLGYLHDGIFTVLSPTRRFVQQRATPASHHLYTLTPLKITQQKFLEEAIAHYQSIGYRK